MNVNGTEAHATQCAYCHSLRLLLRINLSLQLLLCMLQLLIPRKSCYRSILNG
jgi:hypothetical protein